MKVERRSDFLHLNLRLNLNLQLRLADVFRILLNWSFPGRVKGMVIEEILVGGEIIRFDGEVLFVERIRTGRGAEIGAIGFSLLFRGKPTEAIFRHPG
jgi:hypothetical protein